MLKDWLLAFMRVSYFLTKLVSAATFIILIPCVVSLVCLGIPVPGEYVMLCVILLVFIVVFTSFILSILSVLAERMSR